MLRLNTLGIRAEKADEERNFSLLSLFQKRVLLDLPDISIKKYQQSNIFTSAAKA